MISRSRQSMILGSTLALCAALAVAAVEWAPWPADAVRLDMRDSVTVASPAGEVAHRLGTATTQSNHQPIAGDVRGGSDSRATEPDADWNNFGGTPARNGISTTLGPATADLLWSNANDYSIIAWQPVTLGDRVFAIREAGFPQAGGSANDTLIAYDLDTGAELWRTTVPYAGNPDNEWIAYVGGANDGLVYCARGGSGRTTPVYAYDAATGSMIWESAHETVAGPQDGFVFAPNGDVLVGDFDYVARLSAIDGTTVWVTPRSCPVSGNCGCALGTTGAYIDQAAPGGNIVTKLDADTGAVLYSSPVMAGFTAQNAPFVSADGDTVYFARSQNNASVDYLYAFADDGVALTELWSRPVRWTTSHEHGIGPDGSIYTFIPGDEFVRLDPATGAVLNTAGVLAPIGVNLSARTAVDAGGNVYVSNGWASTPASDGRIWSFKGDLSEMRFELALDRQNSGGPSLGQAGTLVVADRTGVYAYRSSAPCPDLDGDGMIGLADLAILLGNYPTSGGATFDDGDLDGDGDVDLADLAALLSVYGTSCP